MRKLALLFLLITIFFQDGAGMIPGPPMLIDCPRCGEEKRLMSLLSGNTFGAIQWSDGYLDAPMLPRQSPVQKCNRCGKYFMLSQVKPRYAEDESQYASETGRLSYEEIKGALSLLDTDSLSKDDEIDLRMEFLHRYNDVNRIIEELEENESPDDYGLTRNENDRALHISNLMALTRLLDKTDVNQFLLIAEFYREAGKFDECLSLLATYKPQTEYAALITEKMSEKAQENDSKVFKID